MNNTQKRTITLIDTRTPGFSIIYPVGMILLLALICALSASRAQAQEGVYFKRGSKTLEATENTQPASNMPTLRGIFEASLPPTPESQRPTLPARKPVPQRDGVLTVEHHADPSNPFLAKLSNAVIRIPEGTGKTTSQIYGNGSFDAEGLTATFNGLSLPITYTDPNLLVVVMPDCACTETGIVGVTRADGRHFSGTATLKNISPAFYHDGYSTTAPLALAFITANGQSSFYNVVKSDVLQAPSFDSQLTIEFVINGLAHPFATSASVTMRAAGLPDYTVEAPIYNILLLDGFQSAHVDIPPAYYYAGLTQFTLKAQGINSTNVVYVRLGR